MSFTLRVTKGTIKTQAYANVLYVSVGVHEALLKSEHATTYPGLLKEGDGVLVDVKGFPFYALPSPSCANDCVHMASPQRNTAQAALNDEILVATRIMCNPLSHMTVTVSPVGATRVDTIDAGRLSSNLSERFNKHCFGSGHEVVIKYNKAQIRCRIDNLCWNEGNDRDMLTGQFLPDTEVAVKSKKDSGLKITGIAATQAKSVVGSNFNFFEMGIGGLDEEFQVIFRKAFASRAAAPTLLKELEMHHARGMLLYGPPGCGKTLIARKIGEALKARPPKIVNGPECLSKWVGGSEENIRQLFADAEADQAENGENSDLHIIIFDEIDAICKKRGSTRDNTGVHDSVVNQLLSKIDGVNSLNNILLIGMTNRRDMIDDALLRPGRLEIHVEIGLPNMEGRVQILKIHTQTMRQNKRLAPDVDLEYWAERTKNFTGAEIEGLVKNALQHAFRRNTDQKTLTIVDTPERRVVVCNDDFARGFSECRPAFGLRETKLKALYRLGVFDYGLNFSEVWESLHTSLEALKRSERTNLTSCLLSGPPGCGKSAIAAKLAAESGFPFVKHISADSLVGAGEHSKSSAIIEAFENAYKSERSMIILDDIDRIMEFVGGGGGARFLNSVLQTLSVMCRKEPEHTDQKLFVVATTSRPVDMASLGLASGTVFNMSLELHRLSEADEIAAVLRGIASSASDDDGGDESKGEAGDESKTADKLFTEENIETVATMLTAGGTSISVKSLMRLADTLLYMSGPVAERMNECLRHGYAL